MEKYNCNFIKIDVTNTCNLSCPLCPNSYRRNKQNIPNKNISLPEFCNFINEIKIPPKGMGFGVNNEPLLNKDIFNMISFVNKKGITSTLFSNFTLSNTFSIEDIVNSGIKYICIGLDGIDQQSYSKYRIGGNFDTVINSIKQIQEYKKQHNLEFPKIKIIFIVFKHNENLTDKAEKLFTDLKIPVFFRRTDLYAGFEDWFPTNFKQTNSNEDRIPTQHTPIKAICTEPFFSVTIDAFGKVYPCCGDGAFNFSVGNIFHDSFEDIWNCEKMYNIRNVLQKKCNNILDVPCISCPIYKQDNNNIAIKL